jgi:hypothetical protein
MRANKSNYLEEFSTTRYKGNKKSLNKSETQFVEIPHNQPTTIFDENNMTVIENQFQASNRTSLF